MQASGMNNELKAHNTILEEIESEVGENLGLFDNGLKRLSVVTNYTSDSCLMVTICILFFVLVIVMLG